MPKSIHFDLFMSQETNKSKWIDFGIKENKYNNVLIYELNFNF